MDLAHYRRALQTAIRNNSAAFGFSIVVTGSFGMLTTIEGSPDAASTLLFAVGAIAAFTALDLLATTGFKRDLASEPPEVITHAASLSFLSVGAGLGAAIGLAELIDGLPAWAFAGFLGSATYNLGLGIELMLAERAQESD